jgi:hypothetical protein
MRLAFRGTELQFGLRISTYISKTLRWFAVVVLWTGTDEFNSANRTGRLSVQGPPPKGSIAWHVLGTYSDFCTTTMVKGSAYKFSFQNK